MEKENFFKSLLKKGLALGLSAGLMLGIMTACSQNPQNTPSDDEDKKNEQVIEDPNQNEQNQENNQNNEENKQPEEEKDSWEKDRFDRTDYENFVEIDRSEFIEKYYLMIDKFNESEKVGCNQIITRDKDYNITQREIINFNSKGAYIYKFDGLGNLLEFEAKVVEEVNSITGYYYNKQENISEITYNLPKMMDLSYDKVFAKSAMCLDFEIYGYGFGQSEDGYTLCKEGVLSGNKVPSSYHKVDFCSNIEIDESRNILMQKESNLYMSGPDKKYVVGNQIIYERQAERYELIDYINVFNKEFAYIPENIEWQEFEYVEEAENEIENQIVDE